MRLFCLLFVLLGISSNNGFSIQSFSSDSTPAPTRISTSYQSSLQMVGGRGWDNDDYLSGLSGGEDDLQKATENYQEFSQNRKAFMERQRKIMETPEGRAFMDQQQQQQQQQQQRGIGYGEGMIDDVDRNFPPEETLKVKPGTGGGSRLAEMMARAEQMKKRQSRMDMDNFGFEQKFAVPLDDDGDEDEQ